MSKTSVTVNEDGIIQKVRFQRDRKNYKVPKSVKKYLHKDYSAGNYNIKQKDLRHMVSAEVICKYWEKNLQYMPIDKAEQAVEKRINELFEETKKVKGYKPQKKYIQPEGMSIKERKKRLQDNMNALITLEMTSHANLFYGDGDVNQKTGGKYGNEKKQLKKEFHVKEKGGVGDDSKSGKELYKAGLDLGEDDVNQKHWGMPQAKVDAALARYQLMYPIGHDIVKDHHNREKYDPQKEISSHELEHLKKTGDLDADIKRLSIISDNPDRRDESGQALLHHAAKEGNLSLLKMLLTIEGIGINIKDNDGNTPLHLATKAENEEAIAELLIKRGADPLAVNNAGEIARGKPAWMMIKTIALLL